MVHIWRPVIRRRTALLSQRAGDVKQVDEGLARAQLRQAKFPRPSLQSATQHLAVEVHHAGQVPRPDNDVIDMSDIYRIGFNHADPLSICDVVASRAIGMDIRVIWNIVCHHNLLRHG